MNISEKEKDKYIRFYLDSFIGTHEKTKGSRLRVTDMAFNMRKHIKNFSGNKDYLFSFPLFASWNLTSACNFRCIHCLYNETEYSRKDDLSTEQALNLADELINAGIAFVQLTGGEAFLRPDVMEIIRKFKKNNISLLLLTNGSLLTDDNINEIAELFNPYTDTVQISLDAATDETFRKIRRSDKFNIINDNIKKLIDKGVIVDNVCTINCLNKNEITDIYKLSKTLGTNKFLVGNINDYNDSHLNLDVSNEELFKIYYDLRQNGLDKSNIMAFWKDDKLLNMPEVQKIVEEPYYQSLIKKLYKKSLLKKDCQSHERIAIQSDGRMYLCITALGYNLAPLGSYKENSFKEIWERRWDNILFQPRNREKSQCGNCKYNTFCNGGCKVKAYINSGNVNMPAIPNCKGCC